MKRALYIVGIVIILILAGLLIYLLFAGNKTVDDTFAKFGLGDTATDGGFIEEITTIFEEAPAVSPLRQISTRRVVSAREVMVASSSEPVVLLVEAGTGHIYQQSLVTESEVRLSNITIPSASKGNISKDGTMAVVAAEATAAGQALTIVHLPHASSSLASYTLDDLATDFTLDQNNKLLYTTTPGPVTRGIVRNNYTNGSAVLFEVPFKVVTKFSNLANTPHYLYPKPAAQLESYLYQTHKDTLVRLPLGGFGFSANSNFEYTLFSINNNNESLLSLYNHSTQSSFSLGLPTLPEKCTFSNSGLTATCGAPSQTPKASLPDDWYKGTYHAADNLWQIDLTTGETQFLIESEAATGRTLDMTDLSESGDGNRVYFINKSDQTLWLYDKTIN